MAYKYKRLQEDKSKKKKSSIILNIALVVFSLVFVVSAYLLIDQLIIQPKQNQAIIDDFEDELEQALSDVLESEDENSETESSGTKVEIEEDTTYVGYTAAIASLRETYEDLVGWIRIENTDVKYPVVKSSYSDPEYYLYRNYMGDYSKYGTIFHDQDSDITSENQLLHGHHMNDGSMFAVISDYDDLDVYTDSPVIYYDTYEEANIYKIVAVFKTNLYSSQGEVFDYFQCDFDSDEEKMQYIYEVMNRSIIDTGVDINSDDEFLTLSTCSYEFDEFRTVVVARKVREGEDASVDTSVAVLRGNDTYYPDVWYTKYSGTQPDYPDTFDEALALGLTDWWYVE